MERCSPAAPRRGTAFPWPSALTPLSQPPLVSVAALGHRSQTRPFRGPALIPPRPCAPSHGPPAPGRQVPRWASQGTLENQQDGSREPTFHSLASVRPSGWANSDAKHRHGPRWGAAHGSPGQLGSPREGRGGTIWGVGKSQPPALFQLRIGSELLHEITIPRCDY